MSSKSTFAALYYGVIKPLSVPLDEIAALCREAADASIAHQRKAAAVQAARERVAPGAVVLASAKRVRRAARRAVAVAV